MPVTRGEMGQRPGQWAGGGLGSQAVVGGIGPAVGDRVVAGAGEQLQRPDLLPALPADLFGGDAVQPGPHAGAGRVEPGPYPKGRQKRFGGDVVGCVPAQSSGDVLVDRRGVTLEERRETLGFGE